MKKLNITFGTILLVLGCFSLTAHAQTNLPVFEAEASVNVTLFPCDPVTGICPRTATGTGYATGLGAITVTSETFRHGPPDPSCAPLTGTRTITTDSGSIFLSVTGTGCLNPGGVVSGTLQWVVIGGTGAFANASGSGTETAEIAGAPSGVPFREHYSGTLSY